MFYALKYKKQFHQWLWHIREPKIRKRYHPDNLIKMLEGSGEMLTMDELEKNLENL